jgi:hypothetical protein
MRRDCYLGRGCGLSVTEGGGDEEEQREHGRSVVEMKLGHDPPLCKVQISVYYVYSSQVVQTHQHSADPTQPISRLLTEIGLASYSLPRDT